MAAAALRWRALDGRRAAGRSEEKSELAATLHPFHLRLASGSVASHVARAVRLEYEAPHRVCRVCGAYHDIGAVRIVFGWHRRCAATVERVEPRAAIANSGSAIRGQLRRQDLDSRECPSYPHRSHSFRNSLDVGIRAAAVGVRLFGRRAMKLARELVSRHADAQHARARIADRPWRCGLRLRRRCAGVGVRDGCRCRRVRARSRGSLTAERCQHEHCQAWQPHSFRRTSRDRATHDRAPRSPSQTTSW
jgi:hypothetical protein